MSNLKRYCVDTIELSDAQIQLSMYRPQDGDTITVEDGSGAVRTFLFQRNGLGDLIAVEQTDETHPAQKADR